MSEPSDPETTEHRSFSRREQSENPGDIETPSESLSSFSNTHQDFGFLAERGFFGTLEERDSADCDEEAFSPKINAKTRHGAKGNWREYGSGHHERFQRQGKKDSRTVKRRKHPARIGSCGSKGSVHRRETREKRDRRSDASDGGWKNERREGDPHP